MTIPQQRIPTITTARPARRRLPRYLTRLHWGWYVAALVAVIAGAQSHPVLTIAVLATIALSLLTAAVRPKKLAGLFRRADALAARMPKRTAIPRQVTVHKLQTMHWGRFEEATIERARTSPGVINATLTGKAGDGGCDGIVHLVNGSRWLIQCKRYNGKKNIPGDTVRSTVGAAHLADCTNAVIVTSGDFTKAAKTEAAKLGVVLFNGDDTAAWMRGGRAPWQ